MADINVNKLSEALNTKADIDLNNTGVFTTTGGGVNLTSSTPADASGKEVTSADFIQSNLLNYTTNRILEIPQAVKYATELSNNTYRLKILAGTTYYVPSGFEDDGVTPKFSIRTTQNDNYVSNNFWTDSANCVEMVFLYFTDVSVYFCSQARIGSNVTSGDTAPTTFLVNCALWYDTKTNYVKFTNDSGANWYTASLPLLIGQPLYTISETQPKNGWVNGATQVFNGIGFIGSTLFSLPGIKYTIANGRQEGLLPNTIMYETTSVKTKTIDTYRQNNKIVIRNNVLDIRNNAYYDGDVNLYYNYSVNDYQSTAVLGYFDTQTTAPYNIVSMRQCMVDSFVTANASNFSVVGEGILSGMGMPSTKYTVLELGASETTYTAPANGWFYFLGQWVNAAPYFQMKNISITPLQPRIQTCGASTTGYWGIYMPVHVRDVVKIYYNNTPQNVSFAFIYAGKEK